MHRFLLAATLGLSGTAFSQGFSYPDFNNPTGLAFNGNAGVLGGDLQITPPIASQVGSAWYDQPVDVQAGFETTFTFAITDIVNGGADGMAFVIQADPAGTQAIAELGSSMGYSGDLTDLGPGLDRSLALEIDTFEVSGWGDPNGNHLSLHTGGSGDNSALEDFSIGQFLPQEELSDGTVKTIRVRYTPGLLEVFLDDLTNPVISTNYNLATGGTYLDGSPAEGLGLTNGQAFVGFTAATGGAFESHNVLSWEFNEGGIGDNYCINVSNSTGSAADLTAGGSASVSANNLRLVASPVPDQPGLFFYGPNQILAPFGNGFRCVGGMVGRLPIENATGGTLEHLVDYTMPPSAPVTITPGSTWNFQAWYRDPAAGGANFNLSDALTITFLP